MTPREYGLALAAQAAPLTPEQVEAAARILAGAVEQIEQVAA